MASKLISDAHIELNNAFHKCKEIWDKEHPNRIVILTCTYRSKEEQGMLYSYGRTNKSKAKVTNAKPGQSPHNFYPSLAIDISFLNGKKLDWSESLYKEFSKLMLKEKNITWGGNFKSILDMPHFELTNWKILKK